MGILRSLQIGISGMTASGNALGVSGDNIANAGTNGFKSSRAEFQDVLSTTLKGIDGGDQFGSGTRLAHIRSMFTQGNISRTENITDLAINGNGFFLISAPFGRGFTRDGAFGFDKEGQMINADGYLVLGFAADADGRIINKLAPIKLGNTTIPAKATETVKVMMNLDSRDEIKQFNIDKPENTANFSSGITVYDNVGTARLVTIYYNKVADNQWEYHAVIDGKDAINGKEKSLVEMANGRLIFNDKGVLQEEVPGQNSFNFNKGAAQGQKIEFDFGKSIKEGGDGLLGSTQYGSSSNVARHTQDGFSAATLTSMSFNDDGVLTAVYNNGISRNIAQIAIGKFENNEALMKVGKNLYKESRASGEAAIGKPGESGRGEVFSKSLELSNVDLAEEFVGLMNMQRNFQANVKTLTTADQMLQEIINLRR